MENKKLSLESVGIGTNVSSLKEDGLPRLVPEGAISLDDAVYDCIVYLIYCPEHERIAIANFERTHCTWLPFVALQDNVTWEKASRDGVNLLIGRDDAEMDADEAEKIAPNYLMSYLHILRIELPSSRTATRITKFIHLKKNPFFQCCQDTIKVNWVSTSDIFNNRLAKVWGPELKILSTMLLSSKLHIINEYTLSNALFFLYSEKSDEQKLLHEMKLNDKKIRDIYNDFIEHCYPSFYMCYESFRAYFIKRGHLKDEIKLGHLFNAFCNSERTFIDFHEFLVGMLSIEPNCPCNETIRLRIISRFFDKDKKGFLNLSDLMFLFKANESSSSDEHGIALMESLFGKENLVSNRIEYQMFSQVIKSGKYQLNNVCRSPHSILSQIAKADKSSKSKLSDFGSNQLKATRKTEGTCNQCRTQQYQYGNHMVTIDTIGRSVEPKIISQQWCDPDEIMESKEMSRARYSLEYAFSISSVPNIFLDLVRDFHYHKSSQLTGLMSIPEDRSTFIKYLRILCTEIAGLLQPQLKLFKINAPCVIIGDIQGNLNDLLRMESLLFKSFPVIPENLVFLGNYSGEYPYGVECLIYLFSLKMSSPNKVFLLRGTRELGEEDSLMLKKECIKKYGDSLGKDIYGLFHHIFALLPAAVIVDETILCVHSGLPKLNNLERLFKIKAEIITPKSEAPIMYEIITRYPDTKTPGVMKKCVDVMPGTRDENNPSDYHIFEDVNPILAMEKSITSIIPNSNCAIKSSKLTSSIKSVKSNSLLQAVKSAPLMKTLKIIKIKSKCSNSPLHPFKSMKSGKKTLTRIKLFKSFKSLKSTKLKKTIVCLKFKTGTLRVKSSEASCIKSIKSMKSMKSMKRLKNMNSNKSQKSVSSKFLFPRHKLKPMFLQTSKSSRIAFKNTKTIKSNVNNLFPGQAANKLDMTIGKRSKVYDKNEFDDFMEANNLSFLLRSHSICQSGYNLTFDRKCLTVFSCTNFNKSNNGAAVVLIDSSNETIRFVRFDSIVEAKPK